VVITTYNRTKPERYGPQVPGSDSRFSSLSKPYIDTNPGAAYCLPISVHIRFGFKVNLSGFLPCPTLLCPAGRSPLKQPHSRFRCGLQGRQPVAVFYLFRHPIPYVYAGFCQFNNKQPTWLVRSRSKSKITVR
jgi:hypothetical protein